MDNIFIVLHMNYIEIVYIRHLTLNKNNFSFLLRTRMLINNDFDSLITVAMEISQKHSGILLHVEDHR